MNYIALVKKGERAKLTFFYCESIQKKPRKLSKIEKFEKNRKNFAKGYLQTGIYVVNYEKFENGDRVGITLLFDDT